VKVGGGMMGDINGIFSRTKIMFTFFIIFCQKNILFCVTTLHSEFMLMMKHDLFTYFEILVNFLLGRGKQISMLVNAAVITSFAQTTLIVLSFEFFWRLISLGNFFKSIKLFGYFLSNI
jgi:hypothetical protein